MLKIINSITGKKQRNAKLGVFYNDLQGSQNITLKPFPNEIFNEEISEIVADTKWIDSVKVLYY